MRGVFAQQDKAPFRHPGTGFFVRNFSGSQPIIKVEAS